MERGNIQLNTVDLVIFLRFSKICDFGTFGLSISMIGGAVIIIISRDFSIREFVLRAKFVKIKTSRVLPDRI